MKNSVNILIADDHPIFRRGLKDLIEESNSDYIIYEAEDGQKAVDVVKKYNNGVIHLDRNGLTLYFGPEIKPFDFKCVLEIRAYIKKP